MKPADICTPTTSESDRAVIKHPLSATINSFDCFNGSPGMQPPSRTKTAVAFCCSARLGTETTMDTSFVCNGTQAGMSLLI
jgi:hypothetical protein